MRGRERTALFSSFFSRGFFLSWLFILFASTSSPGPHFSSFSLFLSPASATVTCQCKPYHQARVHLLLHADPTTDDVAYALRQGFLEASKRVKVIGVVHSVLESEKRDKFNGNDSRLILSSLQSLNDTSLFPPEKNFILTVVPPGVEDGIQSMRERGYRILSLSLIESYTQGVTEVHLGQNHTLAGQKIAEQVTQEGGKNLLCVVDGPQYVDQMQRCQEIRTFYLSLSPTATFSLLSLASIDNQQVAFNATVLVKDGDGSVSSPHDWVVSAGRRTLVKVVTAFEGLMRQKKVGVVTFDLDTVSSKYLRESGGSSSSSSLLSSFSSSSPFKFLVVDQQPYLQGYLGMVLAVEFGLRHQIPSQKLLTTGPRLLFSLPDVEDRERAGEKGKKERLTEENVRMATVLHGGRQWSFWQSVLDGLQRGVKDTSFSFSDCTSSTGNCSASDQFRFYFAMDTTNSVSQGGIIERLMAAGSDGTSSGPSIDGLIGSVPSAEAMSGAIAKLKEAQLPLFLINAGADLSEPGLPFSYMGMFDVDASVEAGRRLKASGGQKAICLYINDLSFTKARCDNFAIGFDNNVTTKVYAAFDDALQNANQLKQIFDNDPALDVIFVCCSGVYESTRQFLLQENRLTSVRLGSFDVTDDVVESILRGELDFTVDQQQNFYGYLPVQLLRLQLLTGQKILDRDILSGPRFVIRSNAAAVKCSFADVCPSNASSISSQSGAAAGTMEKSGCARPEWAGDGWCDPENNVPACLYDGGDCCPDTCKDGPAFQCGRDFFSTKMNKMSCPFHECKPGQQRASSGACVDCQLGSFGFDGKMCLSCAEFNGRLRCMGKQELFVYRDIWIDKADVQSQILQVSADNVTDPAVYSGLLESSIYACQPGFCVGSRGENESSAFGTVGGCASEYDSSSLLCMGCAPGYVKIGTRCQLPDICRSTGNAIKTLVITLTVIIVSLCSAALYLKVNDTRAPWIILLYALQAQFALSQRSPTTKRSVFAILEIWNFEIPPVLSSGPTGNGTGPDALYDCGFYGYGHLQDHIYFELGLLLGGLLTFLTVSGLFLWLMTRKGITDVRDVKRMLVKGLLHHQQKGGKAGSSSLSSAAVGAASSGCVALKSNEASSPQEAAARASFQLRRWRQKTWQGLLELFVHVLLFPLFRYALQLTTCETVSGHSVLLRDASIRCSRASSPQFATGNAVGMFLFAVIALLLLKWVSCTFTWRECRKDFRATASSSVSQSSSSSSVEGRRLFYSFFGRKKLSRLQYSGRYNELLGYCRPGYEHWPLVKTVQMLVLAFILETQGRKVVVSMMSWFLWLIALISQLRNRPFLHAIDNLLEELAMILHFFISSFYILTSLNLSANDWGNISMGFIFLLLVLFSGLQQQDDGPIIRAYRHALRKRIEAERVKVPKPRPAFADCDAEKKKRLIRYLWRKGARLAKTLKRHQ